MKVNEISLWSTINYCLQAEKSLYSHSLSRYKNMTILSTNSFYITNRLQTKNTGYYHNTYLKYIVDLSTQIGCSDTKRHHLVVFCITWNNLSIWPSQLFTMYFKCNKKTKLCVYLSLCLLFK